MVVLDTSFIVTYHNARDIHHRAAERAMDQLRPASGAVRSCWSTFFWKS